MEHKKYRLFRSLLARLEGCRHILRTSVRDSASLPRYRNRRASDGLTLRLANLLKETDQVLRELDLRYKEEAQRSKKKDQRSKKKEGS